MKLNGTIFSKLQQDQLKEVIGKELEAVVEKVNDVDARMLNYTGDWVNGNEYHENDVVTWANDGHLYEVIKAHTSSSTIDPSNTEYYKAMTASAAERITLPNNRVISGELMDKIATALNKGKQIVAIVPQTNMYLRIAINGNSEALYGYTAVIQIDNTTYKEYMFKCDRANSVLLFVRSTTLSNPASSEAIFTSSAISDKIQIIIGA